MVYAPDVLHPPKRGSTLLTRNELVAVMPRAASIADRVTPALDAAMQRFQIDAPARRAAFLAQLAHESGQLQRWTENLNYGWQGLLKTFSKYFRTEAEARNLERKPERIANRVYGGRMGNGDEASGDGWRYRGRGPIQLTGKDNYRICGTAIGVDLLSEPERLESPEVGCLAAAWFWSTKGLNTLADAGDFVRITKLINGGLNGLEDRAAFWERAKATFGVSAPAVAFRRGFRPTAGATTLERAKTRAGAARKKPAKRRVSAVKKATTKAPKPRITAAKKTATKPRKPRVTAVKKLGTKAAKPRATAAKKKAAKTTGLPRATAAKKAAKRTAKLAKGMAKLARATVKRPRAKAASPRPARASGRRVTARVRPRRLASRKPPRRKR